MNINIYTTYEITVKNNYSYYNEEGDIREENETFTKELDGGSLNDLLIDCLKDRNFSSLAIQNNSFHISTFDPMDGTGSEISITIDKEIQRERE